MTLVMLGLGCFRATYPISVGLAGPLLVPDAALIFIGIVLANQGGQGFSLAIFLLFLLYASPGLLALLILIASFLKFPPSPRLEKP